MGLRVSGDRAAFYACRIISYQDTLLDDAGRHYYRNCYIEGGTDFICGSAASLFEVRIPLLYLLSFYSITCLNVAQLEEFCYGSSFRLIFLLDLTFHIGGIKQEACVSECL